MKIYYQQDKKQGGVRGISRIDPAWRKFRKEKEGRGVLLGGWEHLRENIQAAAGRPHRCPE